MARRKRVGRFKILIPVMVATLAVATGPLAPSVEAAPKAAVSIRPVTYWQKQFDGTRQHLLADTKQQTSSTDSWDFYNAAYGIDAFGEMFAATGSKSYLDPALGFAEAMMNSARPSSSLGGNAEGDKYLGWISNKNGQNGEETPLFESYAWRYVTQLLVFMKADTTVMATADYKARYKRLLSFSEKQMFEKWMSRNPENIYRSNTNMTAHWAFIALNLARLTTSQERKSSYLEVVDKVDKDLQAQFKTKGASYAWASEWQGNDVQDVSHANAEVAYIAAAFGRTQSWDAARLNRLVATTRMIIKTKPEFVDGTGQDSGWIADGFVKMGRTSARLQKQLESYDVQNDQYFAAMALNAHLLLRS